MRPLFVEAEARQRTSYLPGEIGHTDWWDTRVWVPVGKGVTREVFGLVTTLPHSAVHAAVFSFSKSMADFLPAFFGTLHRLGGASEKMVVDRDSSIVVPHSRPARLHDEVAALFGGFRIRPVILGARKPQSKGQVERTIGYLETSFLPLRGFEGTSKLNTTSGLEKWRSVGITGGSEPESVTPGESNVASCILSPILFPTRTGAPRFGSPRTGSAGWERSTIRCLQD